MKTSKIRSSLLLLLCATIWGVAFVAQSVGMDYVGGFTFNGVRSLIGSAVLLPVIALNRKFHLSADSNGKGNTSSRKLLPRAGLVCGVIMFLASNFQQQGIRYTTVGKAGFITACYIVLVPILQLVIHALRARFAPAGSSVEKNKGNPLLVLAVALALWGLYLLCMNEQLTIGTGDALVAICALLFSFHILAVDHYSPLVDGICLSCIQFLVCGVLSCICALIFEAPKLSAICAAWQPILYAGALSCGVAYTLQILGQKDLDPTVASLIMSLESCISVLAGWLLLGQHLSGKELFGCVLMFGAIILAQLPDKKQNT
jgi:drug/metabolite transporter (DMT)-like permease